MTEVGTPEEIPQIEIAPLHDPVPRVQPREIPVEPDYLPIPDRPKRAPKREPVPV